MADEMPQGFDLSNMDVYAVTAHEMFTSLIAAGFTEDQAITMTARFAIEAGRNSERSE